MIKTVLSGETVANTVRARRRKAHVKYRQPDLKPQFRESPLELSLRRAADGVPSRNIWAGQSSFMTASAGFWGNKKSKEIKDMQMKHSKKLPSFIPCMALIVAMALFTAGCNGSTDNGTPPAEGTEANIQADSTQLGEGSTQFTFTVVDKDGNETPFEIHTDKETVGEALTELGLVEGEEGGYGLYVKTVNGITADYDKDGTYWAFYVNGEYAPSGVDSTVITEGNHYSFKVE